MKGVILVLSLFCLSSFAEHEGGDDEVFATPPDHRRSRPIDDGAPTYVKQVDIEEEAENLLAVATKKGIAKTAPIVRALISVWKDKKLNRELRLFEDKWRFGKFTQEELNKVDAMLREGFKGLAKEKISLVDDKQKFFKIVTSNIGRDKSTDVEQLPYSMRFGPKTVRIVPVLSREFADFWTLFSIDQTVKVSPKEFLSKSAVKALQAKGTKLDDPIELTITISPDFNERRTKFSGEATVQALRAALSPFGDLKRNTPKVLFDSKDGKLTRGR